MEIVKKIILWVLTTIVLYFCSVCTLYIMTLIFHAVFENIWSSAIPVVFLAEVLLLLNHLYHKHKKS